MKFSRKRKNEVRQFIKYVYAYIYVCARDKQSTLGQSGQPAKPYANSMHVTSCFCHPLIKMCFPCFFLIKNSIMNSKRCQTWHYLHECCTCILAYLITKYLGSTCKYIRLEKNKRLTHVNKKRRRRLTSLLICLII